MTEKANDKEELIIQNLTVKQGTSGSSPVKTVDATISTGLFLGSWRLLREWNCITELFLASIYSNESLL
ncbi:hypothetical protein AYI69_g11235 [Smittium culicis]|uniref:Uncharacterized protein n=1 Tax=Smittium culicis TaxID=133412 RepID=A0A1R1X025_9FUNG|nr:hypothetical protein AYI69_g11235 [Smittium culicis]